MKILIIHDVGALVGGAEYSLANIRRDLMQRGHDVRVVTGDRPSPEPGFSDYIFASRDASVPGKFLHYLYNSSAKQTISAAIGDFRPDVIHAGTVTRISPAGVKAMKGTPTVMDLRDYGLMYPDLHKYLPREEYCGYGDGSCCPRHVGYLRYYFDLVRIYLHRRRFGQISAFIVNSEYVKKLAELMGMKPAVVINSPVDPIPEEPQREAGTRNSILYAGRLEPEKGVLQLLDSFELVRESIPDAVLLMAGEGSLSDELRSRIADRGLSESVEMLGFLRREELQRWYSRIRVAVVPSLWPEPFGLVGPEAMAFGVPVVASGRGGTKDWLHDGENGLIADPGDARDLASAITRLLQDDVLYQDLVRNAVESVRRFRLQGYIDKLEEVYREAIENNRRLRS